jgi:HAD superfamily hydrolase (TIGR01509 family)
MGYSHEIAWKQWICFISTMQFSRRQWRMQTARTLRDRTIRCILFDFGDTLWTVAPPEKWERWVEEAGQRALVILSRHLAPDVLQRLKIDNLGAQFYQAIRKRRSAYRLQHPNYEPDVAQNVQEALGDLDLPALDLVVCRELHAALHMPIYETRILFPDALSTLAVLKQRGYLLGVVTNRAWGGPRFIEDLRPMGLLDYFDPRTIAISEDLGVLKPHPDIFRFALDALDVSPEETLMVGDNLWADVAGAKSLHMLAAWKPRLRLRAALRSESSGVDGESDDEMLYRYVIEQDKTGSLERNRLYPPVRPDLTIEHVGDLLPLVPEMGGE